MISVSNATKKAFMSDVSHKTLRVVFPDLKKEYTNDSIEAESLKITESISSRDYVEFVGCIASSLQINIYGISDNVKSKRIQVFIQADNTTEIPIFNGIVESVVIDSKNFFKKITAYDVLYSKGNTDVERWYNRLFPNTETNKTIKEIRDSLCSYLGIEQVEQVLANDNVVISKRFNPSSLKAITVLKSICQFNGCCGIINRYGKFEYRYISKVDEGLYPSLALFPSNTTIPKPYNVANNFVFYESLKHEEYHVKPMERVQIRDDDTLAGITVGATTGNKYIIQSNMFAYKLSESVLRTAATNILNKLKDVWFAPFDSKNNGIPFVECGDAVKYVLANNRTGAYATNSFIVLTRTLTGVQLLKDSYNAKGDEEQKEFITDIQAQLDALKMTEKKSDGITKEEVEEMLEDYPTIEQSEAYVDNQINEMTKPTGFTVVSTYELPTSRTANTIYLIQGGVFVI